MGRKISQELGRSFPGDEPLGDANRNVLGMFLGKGCFGLGERRGESGDDILKRAISGWCRVAGLSKPDLKRRLTPRLRKLLKIFVLHKCN